MRLSSPTGTSQDLGKYALVEKIGEGYLGPVYRGFDKDFGTPAAIRVLCDGIKWDAKLEELFARETRTISGLRHPNIAAILDMGREGSTHYIAMESLGNGTLANLIAQNSGASVEEKLSIIIHVSEGLSHAHRHGVLHYDLVPGKIHLAPDGSAKIRDFTLAHALMKYLPHPIVRWGAPIYLSPEQIQQKEFDARSDIFCAGTIFYELLTSVHPFHDRDSNKALDNILSETPIPTFEKFPELPPGIWNILRSCLAKDPEERYRRALDLAVACLSLLLSRREDRQLILSELYSALTPLKKAAAQPNAAPATVALLHEIQSLLRGEKEADYATLDRLMTSLSEAYPAIQAAACALPELGSLCPQLPPEEPETSVDESDAEVELTVLEPESVQPEPAGSAVHATGSASPELVVAESDAPAFQPDISAQSTSLAEPALVGETYPDLPAQSWDAGKERLALFPVLSNEPPEPQAEAEYVQLPPPASCYLKLPRPSYRTAIVLLSILLITVAGYIVFGTEASAPLRKAWSILLSHSGKIRNESAPQGQVQASVGGDLGNFGQPSPVKAAKDSSGAPTNASILPEKKGQGGETSSRPVHPPEDSVSRITALLSSGRLQNAKTEIDALQRKHPDSTRVSGLRKRWQALNAKRAREQTGREEDRSQTVISQKEEEWNRHVSEFIGRGKYSEASGALTLWLAENPGSGRAQDMNARIQEIQRNLNAYSSAVAENRYADALTAIGNAEKLNPSDSSFGEMRQQVRSRMSAAKASLTVYRLGAKAALLLNGRPVGKEGEVENEAIPIGSHTLSIENSAGTIASRVLSCQEGQHVVLVYDPVKQSLRSITEADRETLARRKAIEEVERFSVVHDHGRFRGSCRGVLSLNSLDVAFSPASGSHGFRIPFKLLNLKPDGRSLELDYLSDNSRFQTFRTADIQTADRFRQKWNDLKALIH